MRQIKSSIGIAQIVISLYLILLFGMAGSLGFDLGQLVEESIVKFVMNGVMVLAMIPMINAGIGMNFGLPVGIVAGLIGMCIAVDFSLTGIIGLLTSILLSALIAIAFGKIYAVLLNQVKGKEDIAAIFIGYSFIPLMNFFWTVAPFTNKEMLYPIGGSGLRPKISLKNYFGGALQNKLNIEVIGINIPVGLLIAYGAVAISLVIYFHTKKGKLMLAVGENESFCKLSGIGINKIRTQAVVLSTVIGAIGICIYAQTYGFIELYDGPKSFAFPAVSGILIGGCLGKKAKVSHAIIGTYLYQTINLLSVPIANELLMPQMSEIVRMLITNGIILYAFLKRGRDTKGWSK